jgi:hypothetical protein
VNEFFKFTKSFRPRYGRRGSATPVYPQKLALTLPTSSGRSAGIVRSRTKATEFVCHSSLENEEKSGKSARLNLTCSIIKQIYFRFVLFNCFELLLGATN